MRVFRRLRAKARQVSSNVPKASGGMAESRTSVIVVGAGPVGLVCALRLAGADMPVTVLEAGAAIHEDLRASTWHPPTLDMLAGYGLADPLISQGLITPTWQVRMHSTGERAEFDLSILKDETDHPYRLQCEQWKLGHLIVARLKRHAMAELKFSTTLKSVTQTDSRVAALVEGPGGPAELTADWLIAADGANSTVRRGLDLPFTGHTYPETTILATTRFPFQDHLEGLSNVNYVWSEKGTFSLLRLPDLWRCSLYPDPDETIEQAMTPEAIEAKLQRIVPTGELYEVMEVRPYRVHQRIVEDYRHGRILLAGDAAHINSPSGGMGMNGGIHDAFNLTEKLMAMAKEGADESLLDLYTRQRRPIAREEILMQADRNRARMQERDTEKRLAMLRDLQTIAANPERSHAYLLRTSMIEGLRRAALVG